MCLNQLVKHCQRNISRWQTGKQEGSECKKKLMNTQGMYDRYDYGEGNVNANPFLLNIICLLITTMKENTTANTCTSELMQFQGHCIACLYLL